MHHKRKRPKSGRAGCLMCKPHKHQGTSKLKAASFGNVRRVMTDEHAARTDPYDAGLRDDANY